MKRAIFSEPLFDSPRKALSFALNHKINMPRPAMNKASDDADAMHTIELADGSKLRIPSRFVTRPPRSEQLRGMDGVAQAGMVLYHLGRLPEHQQLVLIAQSTPYALLCTCKRPCCSGYTPNPVWVHAILKICDYLRDEAQLSRLPGKKGMSTSPWLRRSLVEKFFIPGREASLKSLAERADLSEQTVIKHKRPIVTYLETADRQGWREFSAHLDDAGIVGHL